MAAGEGERLLETVMALQACVRGHLVRKRFQSLKEEYESIVKQIEGNLHQLQWTQRSIPKPVFLPKKPSKEKELGVQETGIQKKDSLHTGEEEKLSCQVRLQTETDHGCEIRLVSQHLDEGALELEVGDLKLDSEHPPAKPLVNACILPEETAEGKDYTNVSSEWGSLILETEPPRQSQELHFQAVPEMPQPLPDLQSYRKHLTMELLWLQQAIVSRKNYLMLKQEL